MVTFLKDQFKDFGTRSKVNKRLLHDRSHLGMEFPQANGRYVRIYIPFLENAQITERGKARLNTYDLIGRAGQLFSYGGADSRRLNLTFNISLLHVIEMDAKEGIADYFQRNFKVFFSEREAALAAFQSADIAAGQAAAFTDFANNNPKATLSAGKDGVLTNVGDGLPRQNDPLAAADEAYDASIKSSFRDNLNVDRGADRDHAQIHRDYYLQKIGELTGEQLEKQEAESWTAGLLSGEGIATLSQRYKDVNRVINLVLCWINLIRGSVLNNSRSTIYGPPIVRLTHGPMYNAVPCLVEDYSIRILDEAGYDLHTLTPKRLEVTLNLLESRTGNFGSYQPTTNPDGDNLTGWESIIENNDIDPYNGLIGGDSSYRGVSL